MYNRSGCPILVKHSGSVSCKEAGALMKVINFKTPSQKRPINNKGSQYEFNMWTLGRRKAAINAFI